MCIVFAMIENQFALTVSGTNALGIINQTLMFLNKTGLTTVYRLDSKTHKVDKTGGASDQFPI